MPISPHQAGVLTRLLCYEEAMVLGHFQDAVTYARHMLWEPAPGLWATEIDLTFSPGGGHTIVERDVSVAPASVSLRPFTRRSWW